MFFHVPCFDSHSYDFLCHYSSYCCFGGSHKRSPQVQRWRGRTFVFALRVAIWVYDGYLLEGGPINICQLSFCTSNAFCHHGGILLHSIVIHASCSRFLACVNREWLQAVRAVICELRRGFLGSSFHVNCLGHDLHDDTAKQRLCRSLKLHFGNKSKSLPDLTVWWYNTKLYLRHTLVKKQMSLDGYLFEGGPLYLRRHCLRNPKVLLVARIQLE